MVEGRKSGDIIRVFDEAFQATSWVGKPKIPLTKTVDSTRMFYNFLEVVDSGWWTEGKWVEKFERMVADKVGASYAVAMPNATIGLQLVLELVYPLGREIIVPAYTHPATAQAVIRAGGTPQFADIDPKTGLLDFKKGFDPERTLYVSLFGNNNVHYSFLRDDACSLGTKFVGEDGTCVFSFHPRKVISTGEGGMITTNDRKLWEALKYRKNFGGARGSNFKMSEFQAAVGCAQMEMLDDVIGRRQTLGKRYDSELSSLALEGYIQFLDSYNYDSNYQSYVIIVENRDKVRQRMADYGVETQIGSYNLTVMKVFSEYVEGRFPGAEFADGYYLTLPLYPDMKREEQDYVIECLYKSCVEVRKEEENDESKSLYSTDRSGALL